MDATLLQLDSPARLRWQVRGQVQGVGFRPFVYRLAHEHHLGGFVRNDSEGVTIEAQGSEADLQAFGEDLRNRLPPLAMIHELTSERILPQAHTTPFEIIASRFVCESDAQVTIDTAVCEDCKDEMFDARDRRAGYALINCTNCGPRFSIIRGVPYDRPNTTMASFPMCPTCAAEYQAPADRRFHAQPTACHDCGPSLGLVDPRGQVIAGDPIQTAAQLLHEGRIVAIKGLGGFHLAARADHQEAINTLRRRKHRDAKPFALMVRNLIAARALAKFSAQAEAMMQSPRCPIVLAPRQDHGQICPAVAPGNHRLGVMLAYTPIHHLLFACDTPKLGALVMTSGNISDEPLVIDNAEAVNRLGDLCDAILWHDRPIERAVDDTVYLDAPPHAPLPIRRARGEVPGAITLPTASPQPGLCVGGELKNTIAVVRHGEAILSQHLGDLKHPLAFAAFKQTIDDMLRLFDTRPAWIATDLHPAYLATRYARELAKQWDTPIIKVQHHHAHAAALLAERGETGSILALVCDGVGYGPNGAVWGGELLNADLTGFTRVAHLKPIRLCGGDAAARDTRRCALGLLHQVYGDDFAQHPAAATLYPDQKERNMLCEIVRRDINCVSSSAMGRAFDAAAALIGVCTHNNFEAQAPMQLESLAAQWCEPITPLKSPLYDKRQHIIDLSPMVDELLSNRPAAQRAAAFHTHLADAWTDAIVHARQRTRLNTIGLTGGVFANQALTQQLTERLEREGFEVWRHQLVPANDGGLALGQAAIAAAQMRDRKER